MYLHCPVTSEVHDYYGRYDNKAMYCVTTCYALAI
jgi:hypothetical protein